MTADDVLGGIDDAFTVAGSPHRGPVFVDVPMDEFFDSSAGPAPSGCGPRGAEPDPDAIQRIAGLLAHASRPVLILGTDVWADGAEVAALRLVETLGAPDTHQRHGPRRRARRPPAAGHQGSRCSPQQGRPRRRRRAPPSTSASATASSVAGRLGRWRGLLARPGGARRRLARPGLRPRRSWPPRSSGDLTPVFDGLLAAVERGPRPDWSAWIDRAPGHGSGRGRQRTQSCSGPRPTRSTRPASTASWSRAWPTTRS